MLGLDVPALLSPDLLHVALPPPPADGCWSRTQSPLTERRSVGGACTSRLVAMLQLTSFFCGHQVTVENGDDDVILQSFGQLGPVP